MSMYNKQPYCSYDDYFSEPIPHLLNQEDFYTWAYRATCMIDKLTFGRASKYRDVLPSELAYACGQIAEILASGHSGKMAAAGGRTSASNDGYSESYTTGKEISSSVQRLCYDALEEALGADPYGLLYVGVV